MEQNCVEFLENKTILITGATGFLAKVFVEKILRIQPNVKQFYLLVRASDDKSAAQRLRSEIFEKELFSKLRDNLGDKNFNMLISEKIVPVAGDISMENLGVKDALLLKDMRKEIDIIVNSAATTDFEERYDVALGINTLGALNVLDFAKMCVKLQVLLHVSSAYVCGERSGLILEKPFAMGETLNGNNEIDVTTETRLGEQKFKQLVEQCCPEEEIKHAMKDLGMKRAKLYGWPNTYVFTKAMGEMLLGYYKENVPIVIIRPTMITSTHSEPFPGWIEGLKTIDSVIIGYGKGRLIYYPADRNSVVDIIPVDMVANVMLAVAAKHAGDMKTHTVYHVGSSRCNPMTVRQLQDLMVRYFSESPLINHNSLPIVVSNFTILSSTPFFNLYMFLRYTLLLQVLGLVRIIFPRRYEDEYINQSRKMKRITRMVELYEPYTFANRIFDNENVEKLLLGVDPKCIDWEDYIMTTHIPGLITHVLKK